MGLYITRHFRQAPPVEENHRVIFGRDEVTNVEPQSISNSKDDLLGWCRKLRADGDCLLTRNFIQINLDDSTSADKNSFSLRIMQWNMLADALARGKDNFVKCPQDAMQWDSRKLHILEEMLIYAPDIICCQEVDHFDFFRENLRKVGYEGAFLPKPWSLCLNVVPNNGPDGSTIFFKSEKFELVEYKALMLETMTCTTHHAALFHLLKFKDEVSALNSGDNKENLLLVGTTHLKAKAGYDKLRDCQGTDILRFLHPYAKARIPIILCGDFNAKPEELVYQRIQRCKNPDFESAYCKIVGQQSEPSYTTWCIRGNGENRKTVDYVFYSRKDFVLNSVLEIPLPEVLEPGRLPSAHYPSDHLSLVCDFCLMNKSSTASKI